MDEPADPTPRPTARRRRSPVFRTPSVRYETVRNLVLGVIFAGVFALGLWLTPRLARPEPTAVVDDTAPVATTSTTAPDAGAEGSGRFEPTTLDPSYQWVGSREEIVTPPSTARVVAVALGGQPATGAELAPYALLQAAPLGVGPAPAFDPDALPNEPVPLDDARTALVFEVADDPVIRVSWLTPEGRRMELAGRGVTRDQLLEIAAATTVVEPPPVAPGEEPPPPAVEVLRTAGLEVLAAGPLPRAEYARLSDNYVVTGDDSGRAVTVTHVRGAEGLRPELFALDPVSRLVDVRGTTGLYAGPLWWVERDGLVLEVTWVGATVGEVVELADGLTELTVDQLNRRRPPVFDQVTVEPGTPGPEPVFDAPGLGVGLALDPTAIEGEAPRSDGQLAGPVRGVGRLQGTDIDLFRWDRGDGVYVECAGAVGTGMDVIFCLDEEDVVGGGRLLGIHAVTEGPAAGSRLHVYRVPPEASVVSATVAGEVRWQRPVDGVAAFLVPGQELLDVTVFDAEGAELDLARVSAAARTAAEDDDATDE